MIRRKAKRLVCYEPQMPDHAVWSSEITSFQYAPRHPTWYSDQRLRESNETSATFRTRHSFMGVIQWSQWVLASRFSQTRSNPIEHLLNLVEYSPAHYLRVRSFDFDALVVFLPMPPTPV